MGSCCTSRTDVAGNQKGATSQKSTGKASTTTKGSTTKGGEAVKFSPMDVVRNTISSVMRDSK